MSSLFAIIFLVAIGVGIYFAVKKMWRHVIFCAAAVVLAITGVGLTAPAQPPKTNIVQSVPTYKTTTKNLTVTTSIPFKTSNQDDSTLAKGTTKVVTAGANGEQSTIYLVTYKNGVEQSRKQVSLSVTKQPVDEIIAVGTYVAPAPTPAPPSSPAYRVGATCVDGSPSSATGSGACSHHRGVSCWQYSDGTCRPY